MNKSGLFMDTLIHREQHNILTETDRKKIHQTLSLYSQKVDVGVAKAPKKELEVPLISCIQLRDEFNWFNYPEPMDEVPYLLLFRIHLFPFIHHKTPMELKIIQEKCLMSGLTNFVLKEVNARCLRFSGTIDKGGGIRCIILYLEKNDEKTFYINKCIFKASVL